MQRISPFEYFGNSPTQNSQPPTLSHAQNSQPLALSHIGDPYKPFIIIPVVSGLLALGISIAFLTRKCE